MKTARTLATLVVAPLALVAFVTGRVILGLLLGVLALVLWPDKESIPGLGRDERL